MPPSDQATEVARGLDIIAHQVGEVALGAETSFAGGVLIVGADEACSVVARQDTERALAEVHLSWASPGEPVRIVKLLDAVEPRTKGPGGGGVFPGFLGPALPQGTGTTHVLVGAAVVAAGFLPRAQEAVVDMSGPAAALSPLGTTHNLVVEFVPSDGAPWEEVDRALRRGVLALAAYLADAALDAPPDDVVRLAAPAPSHAGDLPRVGVVTNLQTQGTFKDVFLYGRSFAGSMPTMLDANELDDGAIVSGQFGHPSLKNPTYLHQNNPVVAALRARDGVDLRFAGLVISPEPVDSAHKDLVCAHAARVCAAAGFDAVVTTKEGGGNADADMALKMDALEELGITAVGVFAEMAGPTGTGPPIVVAPTKATAMVSTGNYDERLTLPAMERALGGDEIALLGLPATEQLELPTAAVYCANSPLGWGHLTCAEVTP